MMNGVHSTTDPLHVLAISPGIAIGPAHVLQAARLTVTRERIAPDEVEAEKARLQEALQAASEDLRRLGEQVAQTVGREEADIFEAHQLMLEDPDLLDEVEALITQQQYSAATALHEAAEHAARELEALQDETLAARAADVRDVIARVIRYLQADSGNGDGGERTENEPALLVAHDLTPSDTAALDPRMILGICTVIGGPTTHAAILARALQIPAVAGLQPDVLASLHNGQQIAINGEMGLLYLSLNPAQASILQDAMRQQRQERDQRAQRNSQWLRQPGSTADGQAVRVFANVGDEESARAAGELGAEGIGLLRTEFLFGGRAVFPGEQEQFESYVALFRAFVAADPLGKTIVARTLDAGADKPFPALEPLIGALEEANPALGLRGARIHLVHEELLRQQLRALLRAGSATAIDLHIMFPMITTLEEVRRLRALFTSVQDELRAEGVTPSQDVQVGIMVETPAAALMADVLAREVDFFSIGANDLFQYTMAADRTNSRVMSLFGTLEPAVWRSIHHVVRSAETLHKPVAVCGELAADPRIGPLLAGLGVHELSMSPPAMTNVKAALHQHEMAYWRAKALALLGAETAEDIRGVLQSI